MTYWQQCIVVKAYNKTKCLLFPSINGLVLDLFYCYKFKQYK